MTSPLPVCLALLLLLASSAQGQVDVSAYVFGQCFSSASSDILTCATPFYNEIGGSASNISLILQDFYHVCRYIDAIAAYTGCIGRIFKNCASAEYHGLISTENDTRDAYQYLCDHRNEINLICIARSTSLSCFNNTILSFLASQQQSQQQSGIVERTCSMLTALAGCYRTAGASCPSHSVDVYDTAYRKFFPPACGASGLSVPTSLLLLGACAVLLNKMAAVF